MKRGNSYKTAIVKILEILRQDSDGDHPLSTVEIQNKLKASGIECDRRTLFTYIDDLNAAGYEINVIQTNGLTKRFFMEDHSFDVPELRILMDAVQASSVITLKKTDAFLDKIAALGGSHRAELLKRNVWFNTAKHSNESVYYNVNEIENAIENGKQISFLYFKYNAGREKVYGHGGERYVINPYRTMYGNDNYYLIGYGNSPGDKMRHYRVDRMEYVRVEQSDKTNVKTEEGFEISKHYSQLFGMYAGETERVVFEIDESLIDAVTDKFGSSVEFFNIGGGKADFGAEVQISPQFFGWCCSFGSALKVIAPKNVVAQINEHIKNLAEAYK